MGGFDWDILYFFQNNVKCGFLDAVMPIFSYICEYGIVWIAAGFVMIAGKEYRRNGIVLLAGILIGVLVCNAALKNIVARPRPYWIDDSVIIAAKKWGDYSFPSGHAAASAIASLIILKTDKHWGIAAIILAALICLSRVYLFMHFPTDVLGGIAIGVLIGKLVWLTAKKTGFLQGSKGEDK